MDVRIGTTSEGKPAGFDTHSLRPLLLVGDVGRGKTTIARYLTRWWIADTSRHAHVFARAPREWVDLPIEPGHPNLRQHARGGHCRPTTCLVVVDDLDVVDDERLNRMHGAPSRMILTGYGDCTTGRPLLAAGTQCLGLVRPLHPNAVDIAVMNGQGRLDWPTDILPVIPDPRGPMDFPCHRWTLPAVRWTLAAS